jgi:hypothetical protein
MIRRGLFAVVLIGAAFGGGAAINGPGLAWLQRNFAAGRSIIVDATSTHEPEGKTKLKQFPTANTMTILVSPPRPSKAAPTKKVSEPIAELAQADPPLLPESPSTPPAALAPLPEPTPPEPADSRVSNPPSGSSQEPATLPPLDSVTRLASLERPDPSPSSSPSAGSRDWATIRKKMKDLGVARYTIEGEADGHVRFSCVIPVEGLKAVGHHFEAEADDEYQAAEAALKRVALWKATSSQD